jgi:hypothetical protein
MKSGAYDKVPKAMLSMCRDDPVTLSITIFIVMKLSLTAFNMMTFNITAFSIMRHSACKLQHSE